MGLHAVRAQPTPEATIGAFEPSGLNDDRRVDLSNDLRVAVDRLNPHEIDDSFGTDKSHRGAFLVHISIADGSQVSAAPKLIEKARQKRGSIYGEDPDDVDPMFPKTVTRALELGYGKQRALDVSKTFTANGEPDGKTKVEPVFVDAKPMTPGQFMEIFSDRMTGQPTHPLTQFANLWIKRMRPIIMQSEPNGEAIEPGMQIVQAYMVLGNMMIAKWAGQHNIPILYRAYDPQITVWDEEKLCHVAYGRYTASPAPHYGIQQIGKPPYMHATSPLRRFADLVNHLQIARALAGQQPYYSWRELPGIAQYLTPPFQKSA